MLFNEEVLFLHPVKSGGISLTHFFLSRLKAPIIYAVQKGHHGKYYNWNGVLCLIGSRHGNLPYARDYLKQFVNYSLENFKTIITVIRNPYTMEVSRFYYFAKDQDWINPNAKEVILARQGDFETFAKEAPYNHSSVNGYSGIQHYYTIDGKIPNNLSILRFEHIEEDLRKVLINNKITINRIRCFRSIPKRHGIKRPIGFIKDALSILTTYKSYSIPKLNPTKKNKTLQDLLTPEAELAIYNKYKWIFDNGYYKRISFTDKQMRQ